ncbi:MAG: septum formation protein Maf [Acidobacteria bacterium]|nr:septum formation protein Maf [Acidobacteriota bacterium]
MNSFDRNRFPGTATRAARHRTLALASQSPRRLAILREFGFRPVVIASAFEESALSRELEPDAYALSAARGKALAARHRLPIVAADTVVVVDGEILGKPQDPPDAERMLRLLSGRVHDVLSAVVLRYRGQLREAIDRSQVRFKILADAAIREYIASGEPEGKAGAYAIQGLGSRFVENYLGSYRNIVGFPIEVFMEIWKQTFPDPPED